MSTLQVRGVSEELSRALKARAAAEGRSLSDYVLRELESIASRPTRAEVLDRIGRRGAVGELPPAADVLSEERAKR